MKINIITIILVMTMAISSAFAATDSEVWDLSEETGVKGWIIKGNAEDYIKKYNIPFKMYNIRMDSKSSERNKYGAIIKSYLVFADIELKGYEEYKYEMVFYVYTGELNGSQVYSVEGYIADKNNPTEYEGLKKFVNKYRRMVEKNTAFTKASLDLMMLESQ